MTTSNIYRIESSDVANPDKAAICARISELAPRIIAYSGFIVSPELDQADIQQEMVKAIFEQAGKDPDFVNQKDAYLLRFATWKAQAEAARTRVYDNRVTEEPEDYDIFSADSADPEALVEQEETMQELLSRIQELSPENQRVVKMVYLGYDQKEIAEKLGVSAPAVNMRIKKTIAHALNV